MQIDLLFPSVVYTDKINLKQQWIDSLKSEKVKRIDYNESNTNGWISEINLQKKRKYRELFSLIDHHVHVYTNHVMGFSKKLKFACCGAWLNVHDPEDWAQEHLHSNSMISGVLYLDVPPNSGNLRFPNNPHNIHKYGTLFHEEYIEQTNKLNALTYDFSPDRGIIYLFPSTLMHSVSLNKSSQKRYSFAFDYIPVGKLKLSNNEITISV